MNNDDTANLYNEWASDYDQVLKMWGYQVPSITANLFNKYYHHNNKEEINIFDIGCGTGLVGQEIKKYIKESVNLFGSDLSEGQFSMAKEKGYNDLKQWDLNKYPYPYKNNQFDVLTCVGTLTYAQDFSKVFDEFCRITKPGSIIIMTHRSDLMENDLKYFKEMENNGKWTKLELSDSVPYLPNNENYGMEIQVRFFVAKNDKKE